MPAAVVPDTSGRETDREDNQKTQSPRHQVFNQLLSGDHLHSSIIRVGENTLCPVMSEVLAHLFIQQGRGTPVSLRGERPYPYTNLCGVVGLSRKPDVDDLVRGGTPLHDAAGRILVCFRRDGAVSHLLHGRLGRVPGTLQSDVTRRVEFVFVI